MKKFILTSAIALLFVGGVALPARTEAQEPTVSEQVAALLEQIAELQAQLNALRGNIRDLISSDLYTGLTSDEVEELQELLASDPTIYPEGLVTGYYGPLTEAAVRRFQEQFGIDSVGRVGPQTRNLLNRIIREHGKDLKELKLQHTDLEDVDLSEYTPGVTGVILCHMPRGNASAAHTIAVGGPAVRAHLTHGDELGACDDDDSVEDEEENDEDENEFDIEVDIEDDTTTVSFTFDGDDYEVDVDSTDLDDVLDAVADAINDGDDADDLDDDLRDALEEEFNEELEASESEEEENKEDAEAAIISAQEAIDAAQSEIDAAEGDTTDAENLLDEARDRLEEAEQAFDDEDYTEAEELAEEAEELANDAEDEL